MTTRRPGAPGSGVGGASLTRVGGTDLGLSGRVALTAEMLATYVYVRWLLARHDLTGVVAALRDGRTLTAPVEAGFLERGRRLGRRVSRLLGRLPFDARCLVRSCVLIALLARRGIDGRLVLGVRTGPRFEAHAWVEVGGDPLLDPGPWRESRLAEF